ncbi:cytotoxic and regulatory T-cell molecule [Pempheris klunzingeri]|uniref:cytotoxic and regulatory T-cell molecule n=1 Tax=Pempheris klunzingeri TaxID=3127111 RepID=UPI003981934C
MEQRLQLGVFMLLIQVSLAVWQHVTVTKGQTVHLSCPITNAHLTNVEWRNPEGYIMFFRRNKVLKDKRYNINKLSESEFTISISNVSFKDGGNYTCSQYGHRTSERKVEVTVLGHPKMTVTKHEGEFVIKCTAEASHRPPQIFWKLDHGPKIRAHAQVLHEKKKYVSMDMLHLQSVEKRITVKCFVHHQALHSPPLMNFVKIGTHPMSHPTTPTSSPPTQPTVVPRTTTTGWFRHGRTTVYLSTRDVNRLSSETPMKLSTVPSHQPEMVTAPTGAPLNPFTSTGSHLSTSDESQTSVSSGITWRRNDSFSNATSITGWISISETTDEITSHNHTEGNRTGSFNDPKTQKGSEGSSSLLVFLVTCLILCLLVVVFFFAIKLRKAHIAWKRENEDSDPSEESNKSKSSQEERNSQGQWRRGPIKTAFTQYVSERPTIITSVTNTAAMAATESVNTEHTSQPQSPGQTTARSDIRETEL